jgi:hypothetical protein
VRDFIIKLLRKVISWLNSGVIDLGNANPLSNQAGNHNCHFVSRHDVAECGLVCPGCQKLAAERGDFSGVRKVRIYVSARLTDGTMGTIPQLGEAIRCDGCNSYLLASPDTDHGDDNLLRDPVTKLIVKDMPPEFYLFKRITALQAAKERWGEDVCKTGEAGDAQQLVVNATLYKPTRQKLKDLVAPPISLEAQTAFLPRKDRETVSPSTYTHPSEPTP